MARSLKYAVVYSYFDGWDLNVEVWKDQIEDIKEAEHRRDECISEEPDIDPQNIQVIQYAFEQSEKHAAS